MKIDNLRGVFLFDPYRNHHVGGCLSFFAEALRETLRDLGCGHDLYHLNVGEIPSGSWIVLGAHQAPEAIERRLDDLIIFNTENAGSGWYVSNSAYARVLKRKDYLDYSWANITKVGSGAHWVKPRPHSRQISEFEHPGSSRPIDVFMAGSPSPRRVAVFQKLRERGLVAVDVFNCYGSKLHEALDNSKVCLNLHYYTDPPIFEAIRVMELQARHRMVLTETSPSHEEDAYEVNVAKYEDIVEAAASIAARHPFGYREPPIHTMHRDLLNALKAFGAL